MKLTLPRRGWLSGTLALCAAAAAGCDKSSRDGAFVLVLSPGHGADPEAVQRLQSLLSQHSKVRFELRTAKTADEAIRMATSAGTDAALLTIFEYLFARRLWKVEAALQVVRADGKRSYHGEVVTLRQGGAKTLQGLQGKKIAYADRYSTTGFLLAAKLLNDKGVKVSPVFKGSHEAALNALRKGEVAAAASYAGAIRDMPELQVVAETGSVSNEPVFVRADLPAKRREALTQALVTVAKSAEGKAILSKVAGIEGFEPVTDADYKGDFELVERAGRSVQELVPRGWQLANEKERPPELTP